MERDEKMISKENFIKYINKIKEFRDVEDVLNSAGEILNFTISFASHEQLIVDILEDVFEDKQNTWLTYFLYDLDFGNKWHEMCISMDGVDVPMRDAGELYDVLIDNLRGKE